MMIKHNDSNHLTAIDLTAEILAALARGEDVETARTADGIEIAYFPRIGRAGLAAGADASWTDCGSIADALDRYTTDRMVA